MFEDECVGSAHGLCLERGVMFQIADATGGSPIECVIGGQLR